MELITERVENKELKFPFNLCLCYSNKKIESTLT